MSKQQKKLADLAKLAYQRHKEDVKDWQDGEPTNAWYDDDGNLCVEYSSGKCWHYKDLDLPFPSWW